jgi:transposase
VALFFEAPAAPCGAAFETIDADHGRIETRRHWVSYDVDWLPTNRRVPGEPRFPGLRATAMVEATVERAGAITTARRFFPVSCSSCHRAHALLVRRLLYHFGLLLLGPVDIHRPRGIPLRWYIGFKAGKRRPALDRRVLSDVQWQRVAPLLPGKEGDPGRSGADNRRFLEAVLWIARTGSPWRDLHGEFGHWNSVFKRFRRWALKGVFEEVFKRVSGDPDVEYAIIDGTIVRVHQQGTGARGG